MNKLYRLKYIVLIRRLHFDTRAAYGPKMFIKQTLSIKVSTIKDILQYLNTQTNLNRFEHWG